jgi:hypothetical protein
VRVLVGVVGDPPNLSSTLQLIRHTVLLELPNLRIKLLSIWDNVFIVSLISVLVLLVFSGSSHGRCALSTRITKTHGQTRVRRGRTTVMPPSRRHTPKKVNQKRLITKLGCKGLYTRIFTTRCSIN